MIKTIVKFKDSEFGDNLIIFEYDEEKCNFNKTMNLARILLYGISSDCYSLEELQTRYPQITTDLYKIAFELLDNGSNGITTERFCDFMKLAFGWKYEYIKPTSVFDIEYNHLYFEDK